MFKVNASQEELIKTIRPELTQTILINIVQIKLNANARDYKYTKKEIKKALMSLVSAGRVKKTKKSFKLVGCKNQENIN